MAIVYQTSLSYYEATEDDYKNGEVIDTEISKSLNDRTYTALTLKELFQKVLKALCLNEDDISHFISHFDSDEDEKEKMRFCISWMEDQYGNVVDFTKSWNKATIEDWKVGKEKLWSCRADIYVSKMETVQIEESEYAELGIGNC